MGKIYVQARRYAVLGWATFPLAIGTKVPMAGSNGFKSASADGRLIAMRARQHPHANIGIATGKISGVVVIDIDPRHGGDRTVARLATVGKFFPETVEATTCQFGRHLYYAYDSRLKSGATSKLGPGIDVKMDGGYVVAPPSVWNNNGQRYRWLRPPRACLLRPLPDWLIDSLRPRRPTPRLRAAGPPSPHELGGYRQQALAKLQELAAHMSDLGDGRHQAPFIMACRIGRYRTHGFLTEAEIKHAFLRASAINGALGKYEFSDLLAQIKNGLRRAANDELPPLQLEYRGRLAEAQ